VEPERYYEWSDVIFLGRVTSVNENQPHDQAAHITFNVSKSWKGVDTEIVTIRTGDGTPCGFFRFYRNQEYLVYATRDISSINVSQCGGTASVDESPFVSRDLEFLENNHTPLELNAGRTASISLFPIVTTLASFIAISIAAFVVIRKRA
jgi:hypothetical protein